MTIIKASGDHATAISAAHKALSEGLCVAIPTETVYGLAADATNGEAVARIFEMKGRPSFNPLICHVSNIEMAAQFGEMNGIAKKLAEVLWPGPLTLVVPLAENSRAHDLVTAGLGTIGLRCPRGISREIITEFGKPLAAPSANRSGRISPTTARHVADEFAGTDLLIIDDGPCSVGLESTIIKVDREQLTLLRPGGITKEQIEAVAGMAVNIADKNSGILAPGMMASHYAPNAQVKLNCETGEAGAAFLGFGNSNPHHSGPMRNLSETGELVEVASNLYRFMKELDASDVEVICVAQIPETGLGVAINDRLRRAAAARA